MAIRLFLLNRRQSGITFIASLFMCFFLGAVAFCSLSEAASSKKGFCGRGGANAINKTGAVWYYNWGILPSAGTNSQYISMFFGSSKVTDVNIAKIDSLKTAISLKQLLTFNEPDSPGQGNTTVEQAIAAWPQLLALNLYMVSPAPVASGSGFTWISSFMKKADSLHYRVDAIGYHNYINTSTSTKTGSSAASTFVNQATSYYNSFKKPLWITELGDKRVFDKTSNMDNNFWFFWYLLPRLDTLSFVERYAVYFGVIGENHNAIDSTGNLTPIGVLYKTFDYVPLLLKKQDYATLSGYASTPDLLAKGMELLLVPQLAKDSIVAKVADEWLAKAPDSLKVTSAGLAISYFGGKSFVGAGYDKAKAVSAFTRVAASTGEYQEMAKAELLKLTGTGTTARGSYHALQQIVIRFGTALTIATTIDGVLPENGNIKVELFTTSGRRIASVYGRTIEKVIDLKGLGIRLSRGGYLCRISVINENGGSRSIPAQTIAFVR